MTTLVSFRSLISPWSLHSYHYYHYYRFRTWQWTWTSSYSTNLMYVPLLLIQSGLRMIILLGTGVEVIHVKLSLHFCTIYTKSTFCTA